MIRRLDKLWFRLLGEAHFWIIRRACAHRRREALRRLERQVACPNPHLNGRRKEYDRTRYFAGVCWKKIKERSTP